MASVGESIRVLRAQSNQAIDARNPDAVCALMTPDVTITVANGPVLRGRDTVRAAFAAQMVDPAFRGYVRTPSQVAHTDGAGVARETGAWVGRWLGRKGIVEQRGTYVAEWVLTPVGWRTSMEFFAEQA